MRSRPRRQHLKWPMLDDHVYQDVKVAFGRVVVGPVRISNRRAGTYLDGLRTKDSDVVSENVSELACGDGVSASKVAIEDGDEDGDGDLMFERSLSVV